ncbi:MAG: aminotransferase class III-fold pyridoxal phosphate-dependent enzyme, partial [Clostridia bacterium]|nr:aminotransferase class III-fold pyridoxal phosphate-dependent enzyme [Clostridia bacterium]
AEANECAIKAARKYAQDKKGKEYYNIITLKNSFHGRTVTTLAATGQDVFHQDFTPLTEGFLYGEANNIDSIKVLLENNKCAAVMLECVQGEGGVLPMTQEFMQELESLCTENDVLLVIDEVQTGNGRCGELYAYMHYGIKPDIVTTAKGLGGGLPIGACMFSDKTKEVLGYGQHGSTFGGNPICAAGACNVISRIDDDLLGQVRAKSEYIRDFLSGVDGVKSVSGLGLMLGIEIEKNAKDVVMGCIERGVLILTAKTKLRLLPALNIPNEQLEKALNIIKEVIEE